MIYYPSNFVLFENVQQNVFPSVFSFSRDGSKQTSENLLCFCATKRNSERFSLPRNGSGQNAES
jgi:hypothetical protein